MIVLSQCDAIKGIVMSKRRLWYNIAGRHSHHVKHDRVSKGNKGKKVFPSKPESKGIPDSKGFHGVGQASSHII